MSDKPRYIDSIEAFLKLARKSELITREQLTSFMEEFEQQFVPQAGYGRSLTSLLQFLISRGTLTAWQVEKLRHGQWKGFVLDGYQLLDHLGVSETTSTYLAVEIATGELMELMVTAHMDNSKPGYELRKFTGQR